MRTGRRLKSCTLAEVTAQVVPLAVRDMIRVALRLTLAVVATVGVGVAQIGLAPSDAIAATTPKPMAIGDNCLVGRWVQRTESAPGNWTWSDEVIAVSGLEGAVITYSADGSGTEDLAGSQ